MKALDITVHKTHLTNILLEVYKDSLLSSSLGFKGGTAAMLFYFLPRFSVDLDFDLINLNVKDQVIEKMTALLSAKYEIKDQSSKHHTLFWLVSYGTGLARIKVEISTRDNPHNHYNNIPFYGVSLKVLQVQDMIAHKLVAAMERSTLANRDLFDVHYFLSSPFAAEINAKIIQSRTGKSPKKFYQDFLKILNSINPNNILRGLGEVLTDSQKEWAKAKLIPELIGLIQRQNDMWLK